MNANKRPLSVWVLSCLFIAVGAGGFAIHFRELLTFQQDAIWIELTEFLAVVAGVFMLLGKNWARWLALVWMAFHVAISFPALQQVAMHFLILLVMAWLLFRPDARHYFQQNRP